MATTHCDFNKLMSSQQATLYDVDLIDLVTTWSLLCGGCTMKNALLQAIFGHKTTAILEQVSQCITGASF